MQLSLLFPPEPSEIVLDAMKDGEWLTAGNIKRRLPTDRQKEFWERNYRTLNGLVCDGKLEHRRRFLGGDFSVQKPIPLKGETPYRGFEDQYRIKQHEL